MQYDVKQAHLNSSGYFVKYPVRVKGVSFSGAATAGYITLFDTDYTSYTLLYCLVVVVIKYQMHKYQIPE
jgi:hypothetical protein